jgi:hypothetical protein
MPQAVSDCRLNPQVRVRADRRVLLLAKNHIYVDPAWSEERRRQHVALYDEKIGAIFDEVNAIFRRNRVNVQVLDLRTDVVANKDMVVADITLFGPTGTDVNYLTDAGRRDPGSIQVHWSERSSSRAIGYGGRPATPAEDTNWLGIADNNFRFKSVKTIAATLAHEFGHYFDLGHSNLPGNLMNEVTTESRTALTSEQLASIWSAINDERLHLTSISCRLL